MKTQLNVLFSKPVSHAVVIHNVRQWKRDRNAAVLRAKMIASRKTTRVLELCHGNLVSVASAFDAVNM